MKYTAEAIKEMCVDARGDLYDYSLIKEGVNSKKIKIPIICHKTDVTGKEHGVFYQPLERHLEGRQCPKCVRKGIILSDEEIITAAQIAHNGAYQYKSVERDANKTVIIHAFCPVLDNEGKPHGDFAQTVGHHVRGKQGCPKCRYIKSAASKRRSVEDVVRIAKERHGDKYDYSQITEYKNDRIPYPIICKIHSHTFYQNMNNHIYGGHGCPICAREATIESKRYTKDDFIKKAIEVHGDRYSYDDIDFQGCGVKVQIFCKKHNRYFWQTPTNHLFGQGCPICKESKLEKFISKVLTEANITYIPQHSTEWLGRMSLDFFLPNQNIAIECQGKQHFGFGWGENDDECKKIQERDAIKRALCEEHGIKILYFSDLGIKYPYKVVEDPNELLMEINQSKLED